MNDFVESQHPRDKIGKFRANPNHARGSGSLAENFARSKDAIRYDVAQGKMASKDAEARAASEKDKFISGLKAHARASWDEAAAHIKKAKPGSEEEHESHRQNALTHMGEAIYHANLIAQSATDGNYDSFASANREQLLKNAVKNLHKSIEDSVSHVLDEGVEPERDHWMDGTRIAQNFNDHIDRVHHRVLKEDADHEQEQHNAEEHKQTFLDRAKKSAVRHWNEARAKVIAKHGDTDETHAVLNVTRANVIENLDLLKDHAHERSQAPFDPGSTQANRESGRDWMHEKMTDLHNTIDSVHEYAERKLSGTKGK